jgi:hypothetical protein
MEMDIRQVGDAKDAALGWPLALARPPEGQPAERAARRQGTAGLEGISTRDGSVHNRLSGDMARKVLALTTGCRTILPASPTPFIVYFDKLLMKGGRSLH